MDGGPGVSRSSGHACVLVTCIAGVHTISAGRSSTPPWLTPFCTCYCGSLKCNAMCPRLRGHVKLEAGQQSWIRSLPKELETKVSDMEHLGMQPPQRWKIFKNAAVMRLTVCLPP